MPWEQIAVFAIIAAAAAYLVRGMLRRGQGGCAGCNACPGARSTDEETPAPLVQIELGPRKRGS